MKYRSYNSELIIATSLIVNVFNDIIIDRQRHKGNRDFSVPIDFSDVVQQEIEIPCILGDRSIILKSLENEPGRYKLPLIVLQSKGLKTDTDRMCDLHADVFYQQDISFNRLDVADHLYKPYDLSKRRGQPIIVDYDMMIITKYKEDMDQIISNWIVHFRPDIYFKWWHPKVKDTPLTSQLVWTHNLSFDNPIEYNPQNIFTYKSSTSFSFKTWMFPGTPFNLKDYDPDEGVIKSFKMFTSRSDKIHFDENEDKGSSDLRDDDIFYSFGNVKTTNEGQISFWNVENDQEFVNKTDDLPGLISGKYAVNNVFAKNYIISGDPILSDVRNQSIAGDFISNDDLTLNNKWQKYQTFLMNECGIYPDNNAVFRAVYFKGGFDEESIYLSPPSGDFLFNYFYKTYKNSKAKAEFGHTMAKMSKVNVSYEIENKNLIIRSKNELQSFEYEMLNAINSSTGFIQEIKLKSKVIADKKIEFYFHKEYDVDFMDKSEANQIITNNINLLNGQFNLRSAQFNASNVEEISLRTQILNGLKSFWNSVNLVETQPSKYRIDIEDFKFGDFIKSKGLEDVQFRNLNTVQNLFHEGYYYQVLMNNYIYIVLKVNSKNEECSSYRTA